MNQENIANIIRLLSLSDKAKEQLASLQFVQNEIKSFKV